MSFTPQACHVDEIFRLFTLPQQDFHKQYLLVDLRDKKNYQKGHINQAFCIRHASTGRALLDYSKAEYHTRWSDRVWEGRHVYAYGDAGLSKSHKVIDFLSTASCASVKHLKEGYSAFEKAYPFLCTTSLKANSIKLYPSQIIAGQLYLGDWSHAENAERLHELGVKHIVTIHNHPDNLRSKLTKGLRWLPWSLPDVDTADIAPFFNRTYEFIEEARSKHQAVLVHCGAGVSRSATLVMMYLMRRFSWSAQKAKEYCVERRHVVCINDGFWRTLCALEPALGITNRSNPEAGSGFRGNDAPPLAALSEEVVGGRVPVKWQDAASLKRAKCEAGDEAEAGHPSKRVKTEEGAQGVVEPVKGSKVGATITMEVIKPEGLVGQLVVGPIGAHQRCIYGRLPANDVVVEHASVSRLHLSLTFDVASGGVLLTDLQSGHGTQLDESWIKPNTAKQLRVGSKFKLGASTRTYKVISIEAHKR